MANMIIPNSFLKKIQENQELDAIVKRVVNDYGKILEYNEFYFFRGYTDHSIKHIQDVLASSERLATDKTFENVLTNNDIAYYILIVILHDIGMHLSLDGFKYLLSGKFDDARVKEIDESTWQELWDDFINEAKKFSGKHLKQIFGDENTVIRIPPLDKPGEINENDKILIGEFLRRNHPRLAHEISLKGFPGVDTTIPFAPELVFEIRNLIGLIARSHGIGLRTAVNFLEAFNGKYNRRNPYNTHAIFLMVLLRISDYIQIDSGRTSKTILKLKSLSSPISHLEHQAHLAIDYIDDKYQDDPERIFINSSPSDSIMYLKLKNLFKDIQFELDISWAVLGEIYGHIQEKPEIKYRRITSNLDDHTFITRQDYLAGNFSFKANDDIIKLLIAPLYGDDPKYGVRELLQNSADACNEREKIEKQCGRPYSAEVNIKISIINGESIFEITDNGIGMDADIIKDYLLSAGASYRKSIDWQKEFTDDSGNTVVRRSGRFGIGILAAFLLGNHFSIETKKIGHRWGYKFDATINSEQINVIKDEKIMDGTSIKIKLTKEALEKMQLKTYSGEIQWTEWFVLKSPKIVYQWYNDQIAIKDFNPDLDEKLPEGWNSIDPPGFNKVMWTYSKKYARNNLTCNGIVVPQRGRDVDWGTTLLKTKPQLNVFDNNGFLPLSLDRNSLSDRPTFIQQLIEDIYKDFIAYLLTYTKNGIVEESSILALDNKLEYPGFKHAYYQEDFCSYGINVYDPLHEGRNLQSTLANRILISKKGFILNYNFFINKLKSVNTLFIQSDSFTTLQDKVHIDIKDHFLFFTTDKISSIADYANAIAPKDYNYNTKSFEISKGRFFLKSDKYKYVFDKDKKRVPKWLNEACIVKYDERGWTCLELREPKQSIVSNSFIDSYSSKLNFIREYEIKCDTEGDKILNWLLDKYLGDDVVIPYSINDRKAKFPLAFKELEKYISRYISS